MTSSRSAAIAPPAAGNPFTGATLTGSFAKRGAAGSLKVDGFCDAADGSVFRIRFMPSRRAATLIRWFTGRASFEKTWQGVSGRRAPGHRRGPIRVDPQYPWHFIWEGTGEHYFFNGTTAFWLMGWRTSDSSAVPSSACTI